MPSRARAGGPAHLCFQSSTEAGTWPYSQLLCLRAYLSARMLYDATVNVCWRWCVDCCVGGCLRSSVIGIGCCCPFGVSIPVVDAG
jgi:hypothetical protein